MSLNNEDIATIEKLFFKAFASIWENNLEPTLEEMNREIKEIKETLGDHTQELSSINRKLTAETNYRDDLEKRVQVLEKSH